MRENARPVMKEDFDKEKPLAGKRLPTESTAVLWNRACSNRGLHAPV